MDAIISGTELASDLTGPRPPVVLDVRYTLGGPPGRPEYEAGHIPGAVYVDMDTELAAPPGPEGRHPLPDLTSFGATMRRAGVTRSRPVVVYDGGQGWSAARCWWLLRYTGHPDVRVLDGGLPAWPGELSQQPPAHPEGDFTPEPGALPVITADEAADLARRGTLLDARATERYRGEVEPIDPVAGHIPGAISAPTTENVTATQTFLPPSALAARFHDLGATPDKEVGVYCGSGVSAAHEILALTIAGIPAALYPGSWSEWVSDPNRQVARGPEPG